MASSKGIDSFLDMPEVPDESSNTALHNAVHTTVQFRLDTLDMLKNLGDNELFKLSFSDSFLSNNYEEDANFGESINEKVKINSIVNS